MPRVLALALTLVFLLLLSFECAVLPLRILGKDLLLEPPPMPPIRYAAVWRAVAEAARLACWLRACASLADQSGRIMSVVMTSDEVAATLLLLGVVPVGDDGREDVEEVADC